MTTIRVTRRPAAPATQPSAVPPAVPRLALIDPPAPRTTLDGAWWPRTRSLADELPALVAELHHRGIRATRVAYNPDAWNPAPRRLKADGRVIRLGWFRSIDPQLLDLTGDAVRGRVDLLVVPPDATEALADAAFTAATARDNRHAPAAVLAAAVLAAAVRTDSVPADSVPRPRSGELPG